MVEKDKKTVTVSMRMPADMYEAIAQQAVKNDRSISKQIVHLLRAQIDASRPRP